MDGLEWKIPLKWMISGYPYGTPHIVQSAGFLCSKPCSFSCMRMTPPSIGHSQVMPSDDEVRIVSDLNSFPPFSSTYRATEARSFSHHAGATWPEDSSGNRRTGSEWRWRSQRESRASATCEVPGLWSYLGLGGLKMIPPVTICCQMEFHGNYSRGAGLFQSCQSLGSWYAADTCDGHVTFHKFMFDAAEVERVLNGDQEHVVPEPDQVAEVFFKGCTFDGKVDLWRSLTRSSLIWIWLCWTRWTKTWAILGQNPMIYCSSLQLDPESPLTKLLRANMPLPMLFGLKKSAIQGLDYPADRIWQKPWAGSKRCFLWWNQAPIYRWFSHETNVWDIFYSNLLQCRRVAVMNVREWECRH